MSDIIGLLEKAAEALPQLVSPADEDHLIGFAFDGVASALGYLKTWQKRTAGDDKINPPATPRFKLPPLKPRVTTSSPVKKVKSCAKCGATLSGVGACPNCTASIVCSRSSAKATVKCTVDYTYAPNEEGHDQECVVVECSECGHTEQSWGQGERSVRRCLVLMGQNCPEGSEAANFYILERD